MDDLLGLDGVQWIGLIGPDALPISFAPDNQDAEAIAAIWHGLDQLADEVPARMMVRTSEEIMLSNRVDENRILLVGASHNVNVGMVRTILQDAATRILDLP